MYPVERLRVFKDKALKAEMLDLRRQGYSYNELARRYGSDHTTIMYHCQKAGIALTKEESQTMYGLEKKGRTALEISQEMGIDSTVVDLYHSLYEEKRARIALQLTEFAQDKKEREPAPTLTRKNVKSPVLKTDERGIQWRIDERGEWICLGRTEAQEKAADVASKRKALELKRLQMLTY